MPEVSSGHPRLSTHASQEAEHQLTLLRCGGSAGRRLCLRVGMGKGSASQPAPSLCGGNF